jgi:hypothetical protein
MLLKYSIFWNFEFPWTELGTVGYDIIQKNNRFREFFVELDTHVQQVTTHRFQPVRYFPKESPPLPATSRNSSSQIHIDVIPYDHNHLYYRRHINNQPSSMVFVPESPIAVKHGFQWWVLSRDFCEYLITGDEQILLIENMFILKLNDRVMYRSSS